MTPEEKQRAIRTNLNSIDFELVRGLSRIKSRLIQRGDSENLEHVRRLLNDYARGADFSENDRELAKRIIEKANEREIR